MYLSACTSKEPTKCYNSETGSDVATENNGRMSYSMRLAEGATIRARVAFVLLAARMAILRAKLSGDALGTCNTALEEIQTWVAGDSSGQALYAHLEALFLAEDSAKSEGEVVAVCLVQSALFYAAWHAYRLEERTGLVHSDGIH